MIRVAIVGGTGYAGVELLRLLASHTQAEVVAVTSRSEAGRRIDDMFPSLRGCVDLEYCDPASSLVENCDMVFFATPNGTAMHQVKALLDGGSRVVDLAADFRLKDLDEWRKWYGLCHAAPELVEEAVYGLPELNRPAIRGAGRKTTIATQFCESGDNFKAYSVPGHRHEAEIVQALTSVTGHSIGITFVPHLVPMLRGIHATLYARLKKSDADLQEIYERRYQEEPFVDVMPPGSHPDTRSVRGTNQCRIAWHRPGDGDTVVVLSVEDNLVKGAAGQAVQNMNIMFGFDERMVLAPAALVP